MALDPVAKQAGVLARFAYGSLFPTIAAASPAIARDPNRHDFQEKAILEFISGNAPVGIKM
jgi:hypothetical protein